MRICRSSFYFSALFPPSFDVLAKLEIGAIYEGTGTKRMDHRKVVLKYGLNPCFLLLTFALKNHRRCFTIEPLKNRSLELQLELPRCMLKSPKVFLTPDTFHFTSFVVQTSKLKIFVTYLGL